MDNLIKDAELVDVVEKDGKIVLTFLEGDRIYEVNWNKRAYDKTLSDFVESDEKEQQVEDWSQKYFGVPTKNLAKKLGSKHDIYVYDTYASLWESQNRFTKEDNKKSFRTTIEDIVLTDTEIQIHYRWNDKRYTSKMSFTQKMGDQFYLNPIKERKQKANFEQKFGVPIEEREKLIGSEILVKVKCAFGTYYYGEVDVI